MPNLEYIRYLFQGRSEYIIAPANPDTAHDLVAIRHSAFVSPWSDPDVHAHEYSEECYILLYGELRLLVAESLVTLRPQEILVVRPHVPHAVVGGEGPIEHFLIRTPAISDRQSVSEVPGELPPVTDETEREQRCDWGYRIPLEDARNSNCWLIGFGSARFESSCLVLAYLDFPTAEAVNAGMGTRHRLHLHEKSWEYYVVLRGTKTLQVEDKIVTIGAGEILEIPPQVKHMLSGRQAPYQGFTFRVPALDDKVEC